MDTGYQRRRPGHQILVHQTPGISKALALRETFVSFSLPPPLKLHHFFGRRLWHLVLFCSEIECPAEFSWYTSFWKGFSAEFGSPLACGIAALAQAAAVPEDLEIEWSSAEQPLLGTQDWNLRKIRWTLAIRCPPAIFHTKCYRTVQTYMYLPWWARKLYQMVLCRICILFSSRVSLFLEGSEFNRTEDGLGGSEAFEKTKWNAALVRCICR